MTRAGSGRGILALCAAMGLALGCAGLPGEARVEGEQWRHSYALQGSEGPVVVFESGLGGGKEAWTPVFEDVSAFARAFAYDRAGYGASRSAAESRDPETVVRELRRTLDALELPPPYVLVGHSLGGQYVELFARRHPTEIAGVVLVDARPVSYSARCLAEGLERCELSTFMRWVMPRHMLAESDASQRTETAIPSAGPFPEVPVVVLSATDRANRSEALQRVWAETQAKWLELSPYATQQTCDTCGHHLQHDAPDLVVDAIRSVAK